LESAPDIITITDFRRDAAGIIGGAVASGAPVFVTQHGCVTAVILSRDRYDHLLRRAALVEPETAGGGDPLPAADAEARPRMANAKARPATVLVETVFGLVEPETADFLKTEGF
jgi:prevent-host-death family protein